MAMSIILSIAPMEAGRSPRATVLPVALASLGLMVAGLAPRAAFAEPACSITATPRGDLVAYTASVASSTPVAGRYELMMVRHGSGGRAMSVQGGAFSLADDGTDMGPEDAREGTELATIVADRGGAVDLDLRVTWEGGSASCSLSRDPDGP